MTSVSVPPLAERLDLTTWPGADRRKPPRHARHYLSLTALADAIRHELDSAFPVRRDLSVLDLGCGQKPYLPLVADRAVEYRGLDAVPGPLVDDVGPAEALPYADGTFDLVLCTQVLEHLDDPSAAIREIHRVLAPGGLALASTHGVHVYHPDPPGSGRDFWRWTHSGLERLFSQAGAWHELRVLPQGNVIACLGGLVAWYLDGFAVRLGPLGRALMSALNAISERLDARFPATLRFPAPGSLSANYLMVARR